MAIIGKVQGKKMLRFQPEVALRKQVDVVLQGEQWY